MEAVVAGGLFTLLLVVAGSQLFRGERLRAWDVLQLVPRWEFFAPEPDVPDFRLLVRRHSSAGSSYIFELNFWERRAYHFIWNPRRRLQKSLLDVANLLNGVGADTDLDRTLLSKALGELALRAAGGRGELHTVQFGLFSVDAAGVWHSVWVSPLVTAGDRAVL